MTEDAELARALSALAPKRGLISSDRAAHTAPDTPGLYAIYIDSDDNLPPLFAAELRRRNRGIRNHDLLHQDLLYIGFGKDLRKRLVEEDLRGGTSTFFRGIGAVLDAAFAK